MPTVAKKIVGEVFGNLTIIGENREQRALRAVCRCTCGNEYLVQYNRLVKGGITCCMECKKKASRISERDRRDERVRLYKEADTIQPSKGDVFWNFTVVRPLDDPTMGGRCRYVFQCRCGNRRIEKLNSVVSGRIKSCGCLKRNQFSDNRNISDVPAGSTSHTLVFTGETKSDGSGDDALRLYRCTCSLCGISSWYPKRLFKQGYAKCDCERLQERRRHFIEVLKKYRVKKYPKYNREELVKGMRYGKLTVIKRTENPSKHESSLWYDCLCDCGHTVSVSKESLLNGMVRSCGCLSTDKFEESCESTDLIVRPEEVPALCIAHKQRTSITLSSYGVKFNDTAGMRLHSLMSSAVNKIKFPVADYPSYGTVSSGEDVTMKSIIRCFSPTFYSLLYERASSGSSEGQYDFQVMDDVKTNEEFISRIDYSPFVEHLMPCDYKDELFMYVECGCAYLCLRFDARLLFSRKVRCKPPVLTMRVFPKVSHFRFTDRFFHDFLTWFCSSFVRKPPSEDSFRFVVELTMPEVWFSDVTCMQPSERRAAIRKYPVWLRRDCIVRERVFSQVGFSLRSLLALMYPEMHEFYVRTSPACEVCLRMMGRLGFVVSEEIHCASFTYEYQTR